MASLPFSPVDDMIKAAVLLKVQNELLTPRGLRTLSQRIRLTKALISVIRKPVTEPITREPCGPGCSAICRGLSECAR
ncbi:MAG: hypothetical protein IPJ66_09000 [Bacteroidetes bacterium]|nr:hypothetical protein [Bacteroidota bacterium]